jgi:hypothetical protein
MNKPKGKPAAKKKNASTSSVGVVAAVAVVAAESDYYAVDVVRGTDGKVSGLFESPIVAWIIVKGEAPEPVALDPTAADSGVIRDPGGRYYRGAETIGDRNKTLEWFQQKQSGN